MLRGVGHIELPAHIKSGGFDHAAVHLASARLFVAHTANDSLEVIDTERECHVKTITGHPGVAGVLLDQLSGTVFTSDRAAGSVSVFPHDDPANKRTVAVGGKPNGLAFAASHGLLLAANVGKLDGSPGVTVSLVDTRTAKMVADVEVPGRTRWSVYDEKRSLFYVNISDPPQILVFDPGSPGQAVGSIPVAATGPHGLDLCVRLDRLCCACDEGVLITFDLDTHNEVARAPLAGVPDVVFVNEALGCIYVAIGDPGVVQVFDCESMELRQTLETERGAHTIGFDAARNKVYAFLPESCQAAVFQDRP